MLISKSTSAQIEANAKTAASAALEKQFTDTAVGMLAMLLSAAVRNACATWKLPCHRCRRRDIVFVLVPLLMMILKETSALPPIIKIGECPLFFCSIFFAGRVYHGFLLASTTLYVLFPFSSFVSLSAAHTQARPRPHSLALAYFMRWFHCRLSCAFWRALRRICYCVYVDREHFSVALISLSSISMALWSGSARARLANKRITTIEWRRTRPEDIKRAPNEVNSSLEHLFCREIHFYWANVGSKFSTFCACWKEKYAKWVSKCVH